MSKRLSALMGCSSGTSAAEMALVTPLLMTLMFGTFELGNYFLDAHVVEKAVRDGARYAARQTFTSYSACSGAPTGTVESDTRSLVRTGKLSGGSPRLPGWTSPTTVTVAVSCNTTGNGGSAFSGIYKGMTTGAPVVTVSAAVPYTSLFNVIGFSTTSLTLRAQSQAAVTGL